MVRFDDAVARLLDDAYDGRDATRRRVASLAQLRIVGGETVVDLGCGAGHLSVEAARAVGPEGRVLALDPSASMREQALRRCGDRRNVSVRDGSAEATGLDDASVDGIVAVQVFSYLRDLTPALREARRILRPGGRLVVCDIHWGGAIWAATDRALGRRLLDYWAGQLACPDVAEHLPALAGQAGFGACDVIPVPIVDKDLRPDGLARMLMALIEKSAAQGDPGLAGAVAAWVDDQRVRQTQGRFFFSVTNFISVLR